MVDQQNMKLSLGNLVLFSWVAVTYVAEAQQGIRGLGNDNNTNGKKTLFWVDAGNGKRVEFSEFPNAGLVSVMMESPSSSDTPMGLDYASASEAYKSLTGKDPPGQLIAAEKRAKKFKQASRDNVPEGPPPSLEDQSDNGGGTRHLQTCTYQDWWKTNWCEIRYHKKLEYCTCLSCVSTLQDEFFQAASMKTGAWVTKGGGYMEDWWWDARFRTWRLMSNDWIGASFSLYRLWFGSNGNLNYFASYFRPCTTCGNTNFYWVTTGQSNYTGNYTDQLFCN